MKTLILWFAGCVWILADFWVMAKWWTFDRNLDFELSQLPWCLIGFFIWPIIGVLLAFQWLNEKLGCSERKPIILMKKRVKAKP